MRIVTKSFLRYLPRRRSLSFLQFMGIACGVAAAIGMALSARTAFLSFAQVVEFLKGNATHSIKRPAGPMNESILKDLMRDPAVESFSPVIDRRVRLNNGDFARLLGIDPFLDSTIRPELTRTYFGEIGKNNPQQAFTFLFDERSVLLDGQLAKQLGVVPGDTIETSRGIFHVIGTFPNPSGEFLVLMDIGHVQKLFGLHGYVDHVDLILKDVSAFRSRWEKGFRVQSSLQRRETFADMLRAFRLNLEALSLLALFVGIFLIYNTAMFAVVSRRKDAGILRSLGAKRHEIVFAFLTELFLLGAMGGALGGILGYFLSRFLMHLVAGTISNLYFFLQPTTPTWSEWILIFGILLGCGASLLGGISPLVSLVRLDPVQTLQGRVTSRKSSSTAQRAALAGLGVLIASLAIVVLPSLHAYVGFVCAFGFLIGASLLTGLVLVILAPLLRQGLYRVTGLPGKVAAGNIRQNLSRTAVAVAAFMVALSMSIGLGSLIGSFRHSLVWWMDTQLKGDLYVAAMAEIEIPEDFYEELRSIPGLGGVDPYRNVQIIYQGTPIYISAVDASVLQKYTQFGWLKGGNENWEPVKKGAVIVSESFWRRFGVGENNTVILDGIQGPIQVLVAAIFYDYTTEHGLIMMDRSTYLNIFGDHTINSLGVFVDRSNPRRHELLEIVRQKARNRGLPVATREQLHGNILSVFDTTFAVTRSMRVLAIVVAFFGIAGALLSLFIERQREFGIYRALGFSTAQVAGMTLVEGLSMGLVSFLMSTGVGSALALILIKVINLRSFNWTIFYYPALDPYLLAAATATMASVGAAAYPIWKVCRTYPQLQIREE